VDDPGLSPASPLPLPGSGLRPVGGPPPVADAAAPP